MGCKSKVLCAVVLAGVLATSPALATFTVDLRADIPAVVPIVGWGLDVWVDELQGTVDSVVFGIDWLELPAEDPDPDDGTVDLNLEAVSVWPEPNDGVSGNILLATITFSGDGDASDLLVGDHNPWNGLGDLNEGFLLDPPPEGFVDIHRTGIYYDDQTPGDPNTFTIGLIPEPATFALLALGGLALIRRR